MFQHIAFHLQKSRTILFKSYNGVFILQFSEKHLWKPQRRVIILSNCGHLKSLLRSFPVVHNSICEHLGRPCTQNTSSAISLIQGPSPQNGLGKPGVQIFGYETRTRLDLLKKEHLSFGFSGRPCRAVPEPCSSPTGFGNSSSS